MYAYELESIIGEDRPMSDIYKGTLSLNLSSAKLNKYAKKNFMTILNPSMNSLENSSSKKANKLSQLAHWILFGYIDQIWYYFDSLGRSPDKYASSHKSKIMWQKLVKRTDFKSNIGIIYQPESSTYCGYYILYVFYYLTRRVSFREILSKFNTQDSQLYKNDEMVSIFIRRHFGSKWRTHL